MKVFRSVAFFLIYGNFWIATGAVCALFSLSYLLKLPVLPATYGLVFLGTLAVYQFSFFTLQTPTSAKYQISGKWVFFFKITCFLSVIGCLALLPHFSLFQLSVLVFLGIISLWYSFHVPFLGSLRRFPFQKTIWVGIVWAGATVALPFAEYFVQDFLTFGKLFFARFLFVWALCLPFDCRDRESDQAENLRTFYNSLSRKNYLIFSNFLILLSFLLHFDLFPAYWLFYLIFHLAFGFANSFVQETRPEWYFTGLIDGFLVLEILVKLDFEGLFPDW